MTHGEFLHGRCVATTLTGYGLDGTPQTPTCCEMRSIRHNTAQFTFIGGIWPVQSIDRWRQRIFAIQDLILERNSQVVW